MAQGEFDRLDYQPRPVHDHLHVRLLALDAVTLSQSWAAQGVLSPFWRLYVNDRAGATLEVDSRMHPLTPEHLHLVPPWVRFNCWNDVTLRHFFVHFDPVGWPPAVVRELFARPVALERTAASDELYGAVVQALMKSRHDAPGTLAMAKALAYHSISRIVPSSGSPAPVQVPGVNGGAAVGGGGAAASVLLEGPNPVNPALRYVESHLASEIDNRTLAGLCHLSRSHFIRTFHATVGQTPAQYIRERRVARAAEELVLTRSKIDEIAARCGFPNRFYFSRAFTQVMGVPPAKYRTMVI